jgi:hypothetical protein
LKTYNRDGKVVSDSIESNKEIVLWLGMTLFEKGLINEEELMDFTADEI